MYIDPRDNQKFSFVVLFLCLSLCHSNSLLLFFSSNPYPFFFIFPPFSFFSLYHFIFDKLCFVGLEKLDSEIQTCYIRQRGEAQSGFLSNNDNHFLNKEYFLCVLYGILPLLTENKGT